MIRVFLVDDHEVVRRGVRDLLESADDLEVVGEAGTAAEAIRRAPATSPDVAVLDVRLPDGSGLELMRRLRANQDIRGIAISGFGTEEDRQRSLEAGYGTHLTKPVDAAALARVLAKAAP